MSYWSGGEDAYEVDASEIFKPDVGNLAYVKDLADALQHHGYHLDDFIERRELCKIWETVKRDVEKEIVHLAQNNRYEQAKKLRARLTFIRKEFDSLQTKAVIRNQTMQLNKFKEAEEVLNTQMEEEIVELKVKSDLECTRAETELNLFRKIQTESLDFEISRLPEPRVMYSKRAIELKKAESELIRLAQYDDARKVTNMLKKLLPVEVNATRDKHMKMIAKRRKDLAEKQKADSVRVQEKTKRVRWNSTRAAEKVRHIGNQRLVNHKLDMNHAHLQEQKLRPEMSVKPSALWEKRRGYEATDAARRGDQLLQIGRTGKLGSLAASPPKSVYATPLTVRHDFHDHTEQDGTYSLM